MPSKLALEEVLLANGAQSAGFLIWLSNYCLACVIHDQIHLKKQQTKYFILSAGETQELNLFKPLSDAYSVISRFCDILD